MRSRFDLDGAERHSACGAAALSACGAGASARKATARSPPSPGMWLERCLQWRLGQMLAPIALYPDDLLADILMAATYPLDVVEAARWLQDPQNVALKGDQLFAALQQKAWDPSVKSLAPFPRILRILDANLEWTEQLGEAYLADPAALMDAVQRLRRRAQSAGRLVTTPQEIVRTEQEPTRIEEPITIEAPSPDRLRPDLRSFIRLRSLALPRLSPVFSRLRWRHYRRVRLDQRPVLGRLAY